MSTHKNSKSFRIALAQVPITDNVQSNATVIRDAMREAAGGGARLIQFPEGTLSGYAKHQVSDWSDVDWPLVKTELQSIMKLAASLKIWVVLGSAHPLTPPHWPHNSLYVISDHGKLVTRYDKRIVSFTEVTQYYSPGYEPITFDIDGYRFGCAICVEINFPKLFIEYAELGIDCLLLSAYPVDAIFSTKAQAYAAIHNIWIGMTTPTETSGFINSTMFGPNGDILNKVETDQDIIFAEIDRAHPDFEKALLLAKPWRASVDRDPRYLTRGYGDPRSINRTCL